MTDIPEGTLGAAFDDLRSSLEVSLAWLSTDTVAALEASNPEAHKHLGEVVRHVLIAQKSLENAASLISGDQK
jgi:hypothetical protein